MPHRVDLTRTVAIRKADSNSDFAIGYMYWTATARGLILDKSSAEQEHLGSGDLREPYMPINVTDRKGPARATVVQENKILVGRHEAAEMLSISCRALDYLVAHKELNVRRIGSRVLIPVADLQRFSKSDHPERLVG